MLSPLAIAGRLVVYPCQEPEVVNRDLVRFDTELMVQLSHGSSAYALDRRFQSNTSLARDSQGM